MQRHILYLSAALALMATPASAETIDIAVGHQSLCTDTYTAGIVVKELHLLEKNLPHTGKYANATYNITWKDFSSGGPITNEMLAGKLNFGVMGDYPLIVNGAKFQQTPSERTLYVSGTGYNYLGSGNGIDVPIKSNVYSIADLKGKAVSTPVGSAAWGMLLKAMTDAGIKSGEYRLVNQSPSVGATNIAADKIDAHADFCPWSELMEYRGTARKIFDGSQAGVPYLHGLVVRKQFAEKYPEVVEAFIKSIYQAGQWIDADPMRAAEKMQQWTGVPKEVLYLYFSKGGVLTLDPTIKPQWIAALKYDHSVLAKQKQIPPLDFNAWIDQDYIKATYKQMGLDYAAAQAKIVNPKTANAGLPDEIWDAKKGIVKYDDLGSFLKAVADSKTGGEAINATYVYDQKIGLKLFGKTAFYTLSPDGKYASFLLRGDAVAYAAKEKGRVMDFDEAVASVNKS